jgi:hypothetical protein
MDLPVATAEQWEVAFRNTEQAYARNKSRRWVLICMRDALRTIVDPSEEEAS